MTTLTYEQVDSLSLEQIESILGENAPVRPELTGHDERDRDKLQRHTEKLKARIKGALRASEGAEDNPDDHIDPMEEFEEVEPVASPPAAPMPKQEAAPAPALDLKSLSEMLASHGISLVSKDDMDAIKKDISELRRRNQELESSVTSKSTMSRRARAERAHARARVSEFYRDLIAESRAWLNEGRTETIVVPRSFLVEQEAFKNGRYAPCTENGGMYYLKPAVDKVSPRTGEVMPPILFNRHLYVDYTIEGNKKELLRNDWVLCDIKGNPVKPFSQVPLQQEDREAIRERNRKREEARRKDDTLVNALKAVANAKA